MFDWLWKTTKKKSQPRPSSRSKDRIIKSRIGTIRNFVSSTGSMQFSDKKGNTTRAKLMEVLRNRSKKKWEYKIRLQNGETETIVAPFSIYWNGQEMKPLKITV